MVTKRAYRGLLGAALPLHPLSRWERIRSLGDDLNTPLALSRLAAIDDPAVLRASAALLGLLGESQSAWFQGEGNTRIEALVTARSEAKARRDFAEADRIRAELGEEGVVLEDGSGGTTWRRA